LDNKVRREQIPDRQALPHPLRLPFGKREPVW